MNLATGFRPGKQTECRPEMITVRFRIGFGPDFGLFESNRIGSGFYNSIVTGLDQDSRDTVAGLNQDSFLPFPFKIDL